jgi:hypothetical protein
MEFRGGSGLCQDSFLHSTVIQASPGGPCLDLIQEASSKLLLETAVISTDGDSDPVAQEAVEDARGDEPIPKNFPQ